VNQATGKFNDFFSVYNLFYLSDEFDCPEVCSVMSARMADRPPSYQHSQHHFQRYFKIGNQNLANVKVPRLLSDKRFAWQTVAGFAFKHLFSALQFA
jgi:hypothetical protein